MAQQHFPVGSPVIWNENAYTVEDLDWRKLDPANPWALIKPVDSGLRTKWVPVHELKPGEAKEKVLTMDDMAEIARQIVAPVPWEGLDTWTHEMLVKCVREGYRYGRRS